MNYKFIFKNDSIPIIIYTNEYSNIELYICNKWNIQPFQICANLTKGIHNILLTNKLGETFADIGNLTIN